MSRTREDKQAKGFRVWFRVWFGFYLLGTGSVLLVVNRLGSCKYEEKNNGFGHAGSPYLK